MSFYLYDKAVMTKLLDIYGNVIYAPTEMAFRRSAETPENGGRVKLPLLSLYRPQYSVNLRYMNRNTMVRRGRRTAYDTEESKESLNYTTSVPVYLEYQLDIWAMSQEDLDDILRDLLFFLYDKPKISVTNPLDNKQYYFNLYFEQDLIDNTDVMSQENVGRIFRATIPLRVDEAILFAVRDIKTVLESPVYIDIDDE